MDTNDRQAIEGLFDKLGAVEQQSPQRDGEAERFISERAARQPGAPYYMAQTIVMQEMAIENQQREIEALRNEASRAQASGGGGFLSRMFGDNNRPQPAPRPAAGMGAPGSLAPNRGPAAPAGPWGGAGRGGGMAQGGMTGRGGGGFLAGAAQTAMGVAGGVLLGNAIAGMFSGDEAQAAETPHDAAPEDAAYDETSADESFFDDGGGFGDEDI